MKALIIDNGSKYINRIPTILGSDSFDIISYSLINSHHLDYDYYILSGGHFFPVLNHPKELNPEIHLILDTNKPILGICFGFELIAHTFGSALRRRSQKQHGIKLIKPTCDDTIFEGVRELQVYESHHWVVTSVGKKLISLAESNSGIEIIRHRDKTIYGFQFHPEMFPDTTLGDELFANFRKIVENNSKYG